MQKVVAQKCPVDARDVLLQYFSDGEMSNLRGQLKRYIASSEAKASTKKHWAEVCSKGKRDC